jgi:hypothetical protein
MHEGVLRLPDPRVSGRLCWGVDDESTAKIGGGLNTNNGSLIIIKEPRARGLLACVKGGEMCELSTFLTEILYGML